MRAVVQRVSASHVVVDGKTVGQIDRGLLVLLGVRQGDTEAQLPWLADKIIGLRIFNDAAGKFNLSLTEVGGSLLVVSQFTLYGDCRKGRRPGFTDAAAPDLAKELYLKFCNLCRERGVTVAEGIFQAHMEVHLVNDGPVTLIIDTPQP
ncbi:MAG: D-aminoacyl-tRNA deacylase [Candidatus Xenobia bacterium]